jgi:hypothetical protein
MASIDRTELPNRAIMAAGEPTQPAGSRLSALEWSVVAFARHDNMASLREPGRIAAALDSLFGLRRDKRVANPRLEALRRIAVLAWRKGWQVPTSELRAFVGAGFSLDQYELVQTSIARGRAALAGRKATI